MADQIPALQMLGTASVTVGLATCTVQAGPWALPHGARSFFTILHLQGSKQQLREVFDDKPSSCISGSAGSRRTLGQDHLRAPKLPKMRSARSRMICFFSRQLLKQCS